MAEVRTLSFLVFAFVVCACSERTTHDVRDGAPEDARSGMDAAVDADDLADVRASDAPDEVDAPSDAAMDEDAGPIITVEELAAAFCAPFAEAKCSHRSECECPGNSPLPTELTDCVAEIESDCTDIIAGWEAGIRAGNLRGNLEVATQCGTWLATFANGCEPVNLSFMGTFCREIIGSPADIGEPCEEDSCARGAGFCSFGECNRFPTFGEHCDYKCAYPYACVSESCVVIPSTGETCANVWDCAPPLQCIDGTCRERVASGEACTRTDECGVGFYCDDTNHCSAAPDTCLDDFDCGAGSRCWAADSLNQCEPLRAVGESCAYPGDCVPEAYCNSGIHRCEVLPGVGEDCAEGTYCAAELYCSLDATCEPVSQLGEFCDATIGEICAADVGCFDNLCQFLRTQGEDCSDEGRCAEGYYCNYVVEGMDLVPRCALPAGEGQDCASTDGCAEGLHCNFNTSVCEIDEVLGGPCESDFDCSAGLSCLFEGGLTGLCSVVPSLGESCPGGLCETGSYCRAEAIDGQCGATACGTELLDRLGI